MAAMEPSARLVLDFPVYGMCSLGNGAFALCGGGGVMKSGIPNRVVVRHFEEQGTSFSTPVETASVETADASVALAGNSSSASIFTVVGPGCKNFHYDSSTDTLTPESDFEHDILISARQEQSTLCLSGDGSMLAVASDAGEVHTLSVPDFELQTRFRCHSKGVDNVDLSQDGMLVSSTSSRDRSAFVWDSRSGTLLQRLQPLHEKEFKTHIRSTHFSPGSSDILFAGESNPRRGAWVSVWVKDPSVSVQLSDDSPTDEPRKLREGKSSPETKFTGFRAVACVKVMKDALTAMSVLADGRIAVASSEGHVGLFRWSGSSRISCVWSSETRVEWFRPPNPPHVLPITAISFTESGAHFMTASADFTVAVWPSRRTGLLRLTFRVLFRLLAFAVLLVAIILAEDSEIPHSVAKHRTRLEPHVSNTRSVLRPAVVETGAVVGAHVENARRVTEPFVRKGLVQLQPYVDDLSRRSQPAVVAAKARTADLEPILASVAEILKKARTQLHSHVQNALSIGRSNPVAEKRSAGTSPSGAKGKLDQAKASGGQSPGVKGSVTPELKEGRELPSSVEYGAGAEDKSEDFVHNERRGLSSREESIGSEKPGSESALEAGPSPVYSGSSAPEAVSNAVIDASANSNDNVPKSSSGPPALGGIETAHEINAGQRASGRSAESQFDLVDRVQNRERPSQAISGAPEVGSVTPEDGLPEIVVASNFAREELPRDGAALVGEMGRDSAKIASFKSNHSRTVEEMSGTSERREENNARRCENGGGNPGRETGSDCYNLTLESTLIGVQGGADGTAGSDGSIPIDEDSKTNLSPSQSTSVSAMDRGTDSKSNGTGEVSDASDDPIGRGSEEVRHAGNEATKEVETSESGAGDVLNVASGAEKPLNVASGAEKPLHGSAEAMRRPPGQAAEPPGLLLGIGQEGAVNDLSAEKGAIGPPVTVTPLGALDTDVEGPKPPLESGPVPETMPGHGPEKDQEGVTSSSSPGERGAGPSFTETRLGAVGTDVEDIKPPLESGPVSETMPRYGPGNDQEGLMKGLKAKKGGVGPSFTGTGLGAVDTDAEYVERPSQSGPVSKTIPEHGTGDGSPSSAGTASSISRKIAESVREPQSSYPAVSGGAPILASSEIPRNSGVGAEGVPSTRIESHARLSSSTSLSRENSVNKGPQTLARFPQSPSPDLEGRHLEVSSVPSTFAGGERCCADHSPSSCVQFARLGFDSSPQSKRLFDGTDKVTPGADPSSARSGVPYGNRLTENCALPSSGEVSEGLLCNGEHFDHGDRRHLGGWSTPDAISASLTGRENLGQMEDSGIRVEELDNHSVGSPTVSVVPGAHNTEDVVGDVRGGLMKESAKEPAEKEPRAKEPRAKEPTITPVIDETSLESLGRGVGENVVTVSSPIFLAQSSVQKTPRPLLSGTNLFCDSRSTCCGSSVFGSVPGLKQPGVQTLSSTGEKLGSSKEYESETGNTFLVKHTSEPSASIDASSAAIDADVRTKPPSPSYQEEKKLTGDTSTSEVTDFEDQINWTNEHEDEHEDENEDENEGDDEDVDASMEYVG